MQIAKTETVQAQAVHDLIDELRRAYTPAVARARVAARYTDTEHWQAMYAAAREDDKQNRKRLATILRGIANHLDYGWCGEDDVKLIGQCKSECVDGHSANVAFEARLIDPLREAADACRALIEAYQDKAANLERNQGLMYAGAADAMREAIAALPTCTWDGERGVVTVFEHE